MLLVALALALQDTPRASVVGEVRDGATGRPLVNASVNLTNLNQSVLTGDSGRYRLAGVPAGPQHISVRAIGFAPTTLDALVPRDGTLEINVLLRPYPVQLPPITVHSPLVPVSPPLSAGDWTWLADRITPATDLRHHPLLAEPDALQAIAGGGVVMDPESPTGVHLLGGESGQTGYLLDGVPVFSPYHAVGFFSAWNPDALSTVGLSATAPTVDVPESVSGTVAATTRPPGTRQTVQGSVSTSQARVTLDGPVGGGVRYLVSLRGGYLPGFGTKKDASYLKAQASDWVAKIEAPLWGGRTRILGYSNTNDVSAAASSPGETANPSIRRNDFAWESRSFGLEYTRPFGATVLRLLGWEARNEAAARWNGATDILNLGGFRRDAGLMVALSRGGPDAASLWGVRFERIRTQYEVRGDTSAKALLALEAVTPVTTLFAQHARALSRRLSLYAGGSIGHIAGGRTHLSPRMQLRLALAPGLTVRGSLTRLHQYGQSLRNSESVVGFVFPVDLFVGAATPGAGVARSDQASLSLDAVPAAGLQVEVQGYARRSSGLLLVAPGEPEPFSTSSLASGTGHSRGIALRISLKTGRYSLIGRYGLQRVRLERNDSSYTPQHGATHLFEGGLMLFPTATSSVRIGVSGALGRRATVFSGDLEWEACNLLDQGCEFGGSPHYGSEPLGGVELPGYLRIDAGVRKHWHLRLGRHEATVALFGTATNLLGRLNVLTYGRNDQTGRLSEVEMRPRAPLVIGLDWRF